MKSKVNYDREPEGDRFALMFHVYYNDPTGYLFKPNTAQNNDESLCLKTTQKAMQFVSIRYKRGYLSIQISALSIVYNFCLLILLLAQSVTTSSRGRGGEWVIA